MHSESFASHLISENVNIKVYRTITLPVVLCGYETWSRINLLRSYLIKGLALPLVVIKYPTISTNLLKHSYRKKGESFLVSNLYR
jgi:hypothetical protein